MIRWSSSVLLLAALAAPAGAGEMRIAVMEFANASPGGDTDALGKGLQSMFTTDLAQVASFHLVERERLKQIQKEQKLALGGQIDKSTAVKLGKLAGATHLFGGTFTVVGGKMRIDGRLFSVQTGAILLAEKMEGDKDAFFELEKALVQKVVAAADVKLLPKERAEISRVQTADFEAFRKFSQGVAAFDEQRYEDALQALHQATELDNNFKLATLTLAEYERIVGQIRSQADSIEAARIEVERMAKQKTAKKQSQLVDQLWGIVAKKGLPPLDRLTAIYLLYGAYQKILNENSGGDTFSIDRAMDTLCKMYYVEAPALFPKIPPILTGTLVFGDGATPNFTVESMEADLKTTRDNLLNYDDGNKRNLYLIKDMQGGLGSGSRPGYDDFGQRMHLDDHQLLKLEEQMNQFTFKLNPEPWVKKEVLRRLAKNLRRAMELDRSTAALVEAAKIEKDTGELRDIADEIELNRALAKFLASNPQKALAREYLLLRGVDSLREATYTFVGAKPTKDALERLTKEREYTSGSATYLVLGKNPVRLIQGELATGPRADRRHADELRYYLDGRKRQGSDGATEPLLFVDGQPRRDVTLRFTADFTPAADWPVGDHFDAARPEVAFLFGVENVQAKEPMHGFVLALGESGARLGELTRAYESHRVEVKVKEEQKAELAGKKLEVTVKLAGDQLTVTAGGKTLVFKAPKQRDGFYGLRFRGPGYVAVSALEVSPAP